jgi:ADP-ribose pyrophosphatase YjhB (NUDIX family)
MSEGEHQVAQSHEADGAPDLLRWARSLQAIAQSGLAWEPKEYDAERYAQVRRIAAEMLADPDQLGVDGVEGVFASQVGHATPKVDVRGAVFRNDAILLVEEASDLGWSLPGGWADVGESPREAVEREVLEESGYRTRAVRLIGLYERDRRATRPHVWHIWKAAFLCELVDDQRHPLGAETTDARFFAPDELPRLRYSRASEWQIERCFAHHADPSLPTEFD